MEDIQATELICPKCSASNSPQRKYCAKCGFLLREPCFNCGLACAAGDEFCGSCGANVARAAADRIAEAEAAIDNAERLAFSCRFDEAIAVLSAVSKHTHSRLAEYAERAKTLTNLFSVEHTRTRKAAETTVAEAERLFADCDYEGAAALLQKVPPPMLAERIADLQGRLDRRREEVAELVMDLQRSLQEKRLDGTLPKIERLLMLKPDHSRAKALAERVQQSLVAAAGAELAAHRYDRAAGLLDQIPDALLSPRAKILRLRARELAALAWNLRNAPVVDRTLLALAERLEGLAEGDASLSKLFDALRDRKRLLEQQSGGPVAWARPPQATPLGVPVAWLAEFKRIECLDSPRTIDCKRNPGRFAVACGLGLAALGQAAMDIDLLALGQAGVMDRMNKFLRPKSVRAAWGLDVGSGALKAVKMSWNAASKRAVVEDAMLVEHAKPLHHAANEIEENKLIVESLNKLLATRQIKGDRVCAGLPGCMSLCRQFDVPSAGPRQARKLVEYETRLHLNYPLDQLVWDYHLFGGGESNCKKPNGGGGMRTVLVAAKLKAVERFLESYRQAGLSVEMLQPGFIALHNLLTHACLPPAESGPTDCPAVVGVDIGCRSTNIVVSAADSFWFHGCGVAGEHVTRALLAELKLGRAQAEQLKRSLESAESFSAVERAVTPLFENILQETRHCMALQTAERPDRPCRQVFGLGGGFAMHGVFRYFRRGK